MTFSAYSDYKEAGFEWLESIPKHWLTSKVRYEFTFGKGLAITKANLIDSGVPCVNYGEIHSKYGFEVDPKNQALTFVSEEYLESSPNSLLSNGDFVFADTSEDIEGSGNFTQLISDDAVFAGYHTIILRPARSTSHPRYMAYLFDSVEYRNQIRNLVKGVKVFSVTQEILKATQVWLPPFDEQSAIAEFLDRETAKIDYLIEKQERLIRLLEEKCQAVVSHSVTKGINSNVSLIESGKDWLGKVPEHWEEKKIGHMFKQEKKQNFPDLEVLSVYRDYGVIKKSSRGDNNNKTPENLSLYQLVEIGDLVINKMKAWQGSMGISEYIGITSPDYVVLKPTHSEFPKFIHYSLRAKHMPDLYRVISNGVRPAQWRLETEKFSQLQFYFPPVSEQVEIVNYIEDTLEKYADLVHHAQRSISLLRERRSALISVAVTGKINVVDAE